MKNSLKCLVPLMLLVVVFACKKSGTTDTPPVVVPDTTVPVITLTDPTAGKSVVLGAALHLQMDLSDNVELKSYKVVITKSLKGVSTSDWAYTNTWSIAAGKKTMAVNHNEIVVPLTGAGGNQTTTGNYDVTITCLDTSNNEASKTLSVALTK
ncbi:MAG: DUF4625 domain-containing protein [Prolixibacteraceae bacterium]